MTLRRTAGPTRRRTATVTAVLLVAVAVVPGSAAASSLLDATGSAAVTAPAPITPRIPAALKANTGQSVQQLRDEVLAATLLATHGVHSVCAQCDAQIVTTVPGGATPVSSTLPAGYGPADLAKAYQLPATSTSTATIAVIDAGVDGSLARDLAVYRATYGLPACTVASGCLRLLDYSGGGQPAPQTKAPGTLIEEGTAEETSLDMDAASAACPSCRLMEISVPWQDAQDDNDVSTGDFSAAVRRAVADGASAVSISYGYTPDVTDTQGSDLAAFAHRGVAVAASTGDGGFNGGLHQSWPADLPTVTAVGGTTLPSTGPETAWWAAGSGCETDFAAADGQPRSATAACGGHRAAADVSADADPATGYAVYDTYAPYDHVPDDWAIIGGTSGSSPFIAGLYARAGHLAGVAGPDALYSAPAADFHDITGGNNEIYLLCSGYPGVSASLCNAGRGWDGPTGLGTPHGLGAF
jgi:subtilase family serine protease